MHLQVRQGAFFCLSIYMKVGVSTLHPIHLASFFVIRFSLFCYLKERSEGPREHKEEWMLPRSFLPTVVWMTKGSMVNRVKGLGINFRVYMYTNG